MHCPIVFPLVLCTGLCFYGATVGAQQIDPTGTYILKGEVRDNKVMGHSGEIRAKLLNAEKLTLCFYIDKGYPDYLSGALLDTLSYDGNRAAYFSHDSSCMLGFYFKPTGVELIHVFSQPGNDGGFAPGVLTGAFFKKTSSLVPLIQDLAKLRAVGP